EPDTTRFALRRPGFDPFQQRRVFERILLYALAAGVRSFERRLLQQQALLGLHYVDAPPARFLDHGIVIRIRIVPKQRELEPALAIQSAMTVAPVAAEFREDRCDVSGEFPSLDPGRIDYDRGIRGAVRHCRGDLYHSF